MEKSIAIQEVVADKGYHTNQKMIDLQAAEIRSYVSQPDRRRRDWSAASDARAPVYANRRRTRGLRGQALWRARGERVERTLAYLYETGGMRRACLRTHDNILKRILIHAGAFNLGLLLRKLTGVGKPRVLQGALSAALLLLCGAWRAISALVVATTTWALRALLSQYAYQGSQRGASTTGC